MNLSHRDQEPFSHAFSFDNGLKTAPSTAARITATALSRGPLWLTLLNLACNTEHELPDQNATESSGIVTTGLDDPTEGVVDDTGAPPPYFCLYGDANGFPGVKQQCNIEYDLDVTFDFSPIVGSPFQIPLALTGVQTVSDESTYEHPFVAICCSDVRDHPDWEFDDSCEYEHHKACMSDFIEHICNAPGTWLQSIAHEHIGNGAEAISGAAEWLKDHRQECYDHFWTGPDSLFNANYCDSEYDSFFDHTPWEPSETFQYVLAGIPVASVSNITVSPRSSFGENVPVPPPTSAEACSAPPPNDGEAPPLSLPGSTGSFFTLVEPIAADVIGPEYNLELISGSGEFGTDSVLQWYTDGSGDIEVEHWTMREQAATTVGTTSFISNVDRFKLVLMRPRTATAISGGWQLDTGTVVFDLAATVDEISANVQATNSSDITLHTINGGTDDCPATIVTCLVSDPFTIDYQDSFDQLWTLDIAKATWQP